MALRINLASGHTFTNSYILSKSLSDTSYFQGFRKRVLLFEKP